MGFVGTFRASIGGKETMVHGVRTGEGRNADAGAKEVKVLQRCHVLQSASSESVGIRRGLGEFCVFLCFHAK